MAVTRVQEAVMVPLQSDNSIFFFRFSNRDYLLYRYFLPIILFFFLFVVRTLRELFVHLV